MRQKYSIGIKECTVSPGLTQMGHKEWAIFHLLLDQWD